MLLWLVILINTVTGRNIENLYLNCSILILEKTTNEFYSNSVYLLREDHSGDEFITELAKQIKQPIIISDKILNSPSPYYNILPIAYFMYTSNYNKFESLFLRLNTTHPNWRPRTKFIVLLQTAPIEDKAAVENIARTLYAANVYSFVILMSSLNEDSISIYTWFPFDDASRCGTVVNLIKINECTGNRFAQDVKLYAEYRVNKKLLKRCTLRVGAFHWPPYIFQNDSSVNPPPQRNTVQPKSIKFVNGYHVQTVNALSQVYDLRIQYVTIEAEGRWGTLLDNGTWAGGLGALQAGKTDILIGGALQTSLRFSSFDCSPTYHSIFLKFHLPRPGKLPHWENMIRVFSLTFWITVSTIYIGTSIFICNLSRISGDLEKPYFSSYMNCFLTLWRMVLGSSTYCIPKSKAVRVVFLSWLVYCFHVTLVYTSALLGVITTPMIHESIKTIKELSSSRLAISVVPQFIQISTMMDEEMKRLITNNFGARSVNYTDGIKRLLTKKDVAIFDPEDHFQIIFKEKISETYSLDNDVVRFNPGIYGRRGSIYLKFLDRIQLRVLENGLFSKWQEDITLAYKYKKHRRVNYENEVFPLTLEELSGSFYVLIFGLVLSVIVYCLELTTYKFHVSAIKKN